MQCEMCGKDARLFLAIVENVKMKVCSECAKFGKVLKQETEPLPEKKRQKILKKTRAKEEIVEIIIPDYSKKIRRAREKLGLDQEEFAKRIALKESVIHKIETGHHKPSIETARKLEKVLNIVLVMEYEEEKKEYKPGETKAFTIGDLIKK
ncbi:multiprotein bridging factor aMBF1 [Candidatus Woesearchaeota archaeon]|nr:multiprotein bridging factor aMBF1 [Candidatus Woesearchaeota archaeon]